MKKNKSPFVSVIMPVYNTEKYVKQALKSILNQTYRKFELIIVDDSSTDSTSRILKDFKKKDNRVVLIQNKGNVGVTISLNKALTASKGKYIIRMDADDWSYPERIELQVNLMEKHPAVVVSGSYVEVCDGNLRTKYIRKYKLYDTSIREHLFRYSPFAHPATIWRADILKKEKYDARIQVCQDYELYFRVGMVGKFMNLGKPLLKLRMHDKSVSATRSDLQLKNTVLIRLSAVLYLGYNMTRFDKFNNFVQEIFISIIPAKLRFYLFNILRRFDFY